MFARQGKQSIEDTTVPTLVHLINISATSTVTPGYVLLNFRLATLLIPLEYLLTLLQFRKPPNPAFRITPPPHHTTGSIGDRFEFTFFS
jgi:hypothetical protein